MNIYWEEHDNTLEKNTLSSVGVRKSGYDITGGDGKKDSVANVNHKPYNVI
jgi:hypothetical protein